MRSFSWKISVNWADKFVDLLLVIIGISIAFNLNSWNVDRVNQEEERSYLKSFLAESRENRERVQPLIGSLEERLRRADTLAQGLSEADMPVADLLDLTRLMMVHSTFRSSTVTLDNITYSGEFSLIRNQALRREIIKTYELYGVIAGYEELTLGYIKKYLGSFLLNEAITLEDRPAELRDRLQSIILPYRGQLSQQLVGYEYATQQLDALILELEGELAG